MKQSLQLRLGQSLTMTPQLQQAIRLLQLSTLDLQAEIQEALDSNPLLEVGEGEDGAASSDDVERSREQADEINNVAAADNQDSAVDLQNADSMPDELPVDSNWDDVYDSITPAATSLSTPSNDYDGFENQSESSESLKEHLLWQAELTPFSDNDRALAEAIIDSIDDDGYLSTSLEDILSGFPAESGLELDEVEAVLRQLQNFDPLGVAARNLQECLLIQLRKMDQSAEGVADAILVVRDHFDLLGARDYNQLMRKLKLSREGLQQAVDVIQSTNPRPGGTVASTAAEYIVPDVSVRKDNGSWRVELNADAMPRLRVNNQYASMIRRADNSADNTYLKNHLQEARWFIKSLVSRNETLLKVATAIVERQRGFLEYGEEAMKAMVLADIAEELSMHESTISRVTTKKYMHTPRGIFELKYFFSSHVSTATGGACSSTAIRALIKKLILEENPAKPLSDSKLAKVLEEQGINVARRTVAKYREAAAIPPSNERKRLV